MTPLSVQGRETDGSVQVSNSGGLGGMGLCGLRTLKCTLVELWDPKITVLVQVLMGFLRLKAIIGSAYVVLGVCVCVCV